MEGFFLYSCLLLIAYFNMCDARKKREEGRNTSLNEFVAIIVIALNIILFLILIS